MSNAEETSVVVERDGVRVEKSFEPDDFPVPAIAFILRSEREESVEVRLADRVPEDVAAEDIGFHPQFGAEFWSVEDGRIVFEREFEGGEEYTTVYGLRASETDDVARYMSEPELDQVEPELDSGRAVRDVIGGDESANGDGGDDADAEEAVEPLELNDPNDPGDATESEAGAAVDETGTDTDATSAADSTGATDVEPDAGTDTAADVGDDGSLVAALAEEVRAGRASDEEVAALRQALDVEREGGSVDARISRLQTAVGDLQAYTDALEEFLEENGDAQTLLREVRDEVERVETEVESVRERASASAEAVDGFEDELTALSDDLEAVHESVESVEERIEETAEEAAEARETAESANETAEGAREDANEALDVAESADERATALDDDVEAIHEDLDDLHVAVDETSEEVASLDGDVEGLAADVASLQENVDDDVAERVATIEDDVDEIRTDIEELREMRDRLTSAFGAVDASDESDEE